MQQLVARSKIKEKIFTFSVPHLADCFWNRVWYIETFHWVFCRNSLHTNYYSENLNKQNMARLHCSLQKKVFSAVGETVSIVRTLET